MTQQATQTLQQLKNEAFALAKSLGLRCCTTKHFKKHVGEGLDLRTKNGWAMLFGRLMGMAPLNVLSDYLAAS